METGLLDVTSFPPALVWISSSFHADKIQPIPINYHGSCTDLIYSLLQEKLAAFIPSETTLISLAMLTKKGKETKNQQMRNTSDMHIPDENPQQAPPRWQRANRQELWQNYCGNCTFSGDTGELFSISNRCNRMSARHGIEMPACFCLTWGVSQCLRQPEEQVKKTKNNKEKNIRSTQQEQCVCCVCMWVDWWISRESADTPLFSSDVIARQWEQTRKHITV